MLELLDDRFPLYVPIFRNLIWWFNLSEILHVCLWPLNILTILRDPKQLRLRLTLHLVSDQADHQVHQAMVDTLQSLSRWSRGKQLSWVVDLTNKNVSKMLPSQQSRDVFKGFQNKGGVCYERQEMAFVFNSYIKLIQIWTDCTFKHILSTQLCTKSCHQTRRSGVY